ncbi:ribose-phosphate pyrophosphokinase [Panacibacter ginsenosidivorans]|uniref:ribose-phosphate diphosphokinase n=1 Tax=Panacibacter ginsenosidivorans TaxID=1813871 RepID=A0A5B8VCZ9_9BACT|nr:ribose-phosphate pyrophosphokinase [Panacibacter ginsenosidivorans]QEC69192.1 ribose-phosphate pyrophosphokinase [Panacibacter ginsenosidivorans]
MKLFSLFNSIEFGEQIAKELNIPLSMHEEREFEDGEHKIRSMENVRNEEVFVIHSLYSDGMQSVNDKLCRLLFFIGALKDASAKNVTAVVPYLCYARKDRKTKSRDPITTRYIAQLFEAVGTDRIITMDVHNIQAFQNSFRCSTENLEAKKIFADYLAPLISNENVVIVSPDIGGIKRAEQFQQSLQKRMERNIPLAFMEKYRSQGVVSGSILLGEVKDKTAIIVDDLISTGTTIARTATACKKAGAKKIFALATHGIFTGNPDEVFGKEMLQQIIITNTIPPFRLNNTKTKEKVTVLNAATLFAETIKRINEGGSITALLND